MSVFIKNSVIILIVFLAIGSFLHAETNNSRFEVAVDRATLGLDDILHLNITMHNTQNFEAPKLPEINGFKSRYVGPSTMMSIVNGKSSSSVTHLYRLIPLRKGTFTIPSIAVDYDGQSFSSTPIEVEVVNAKQSKKDDFSIPQEAQSQLEDRIFLMLEVQKKTAYINEKIPVKMKLYVGRLAVRDVQYPQINLEGFSSEPIKKPKQYPEVLRGMTYDVLEFSTNIYAVKPGNFNIGPAKTRCSIVMRKQSFRRRSSLFDDFFGEDVFNDFFGKYETYPFDLASQTDSVIIMPLPKKGRPETFSGAVGSFSFDMDAEPKSVKVGDPITVKYFE